MKRPTFACRRSVRLEQDKLGIFRIRCPLVRDKGITVSEGVHFAADCEDFQRDVALPARAKVLESLSGDVCSSSYFDGGCYVVRAFRYAGHLRSP